MNSFREHFHPPKCLKPMEKMVLQELMYLAVIIKLSFTLLKMANPVETRVLDLKGNILLK